MQAVVAADAIAVEGEEAAMAEAATAAPAPVEEEEEAAEQEEAVAVVTEAVQADNVLLPAATESTAVVEVVEAEPEVNAEAEAAEAANEVAVPTVAVNEGAVPADIAAEVAVEVDMETEPAAVALVLTKRQAPELTTDCNVYRYGSLATSVAIVQGIESVEIVQVANVVSLTTELEQNAVDLTISCQGSLPSEVCTVVSDADCVTPVETVCSAALPSPDCQLVLRQFFNDSGVFCINVSLTNDVSLAVASARVSVTVGSSGSSAGTAATILGVMVLVGIVGTAGLMYRRLKQYQPLSEDSEGSGVSTVTSVPLLLWNLLSRQSPGESRPLLQGRGV
ncbi:Melanocyte protein PMEL [Merluccius polli]|uniref:Melanocyte protein PMEL n=1 Tax=Merluccius polli TaxID=89951 RepID=A0AA47MRY7_MERPO|nr:Melanocyte protein PMEL [Merluccius polli]